jgi:tungstate transport system substrate-binding protein
MLNPRCFVAITASLVFATSAFGQTKSIVVASTTSMQDSGLFEHILPLFKARSGTDVKIVAQDTGRIWCIGGTRLRCR